MNVGEYVKIEDTTWPVNVGKTQWQLRYAPDAVNTLFAASVVSAYAHLIDPTITQAEAVAALKRGRKAQAAYDAARNVRDDD